MLGRVAASERANGKFVVDIKPVGDGRAVLQYLAPYVHRVAISDQRILEVDDRSVKFSYTQSGSSRSRTWRVTGEEFVRGFLQHVLPRGMQKVRHYGWMSSNSRTSLDEVHWLVWMFLGWVYCLASGHAPQPEREPRRPPTCPSCGGQADWTATFDRRHVRNRRGQYQPEIAAWSTYPSQARIFGESYCAFFATPSWISCAERASWNRARFGRRTPAVHAVVVRGTDRRRPPSLVQGIRPCDQRRGGH